MKNGLHGSYKVLQFIELIYIFNQESKLENALCLYLMLDLELHALSLPS